MALADILSAEQIIPEMRATERWPAIVELIDLLVSQNKIKPPDRDNILASLKQRAETNCSRPAQSGRTIMRCNAATERRGYNSWRRSNQPWPRSLLKLCKRLACPTRAS